VVWILDRARFVAVITLTVVLATAGCSSSSSSSSATKSSSSSPSAPPSSPSATASTSASGTESADAAKIAAAWSEFFDGTTPASRKAQLLQNGQTFAPVITALGSSPLAKSTKATVTKVTVESADKATVTYSITLGGQPALTNQTGTAVNVGGQWLVGDASFCQLLALQGAAPPMCKIGSTGSS
jgi:hypothetical protein